MSESTYVRSWKATISIVGVICFAMQSPGMAMKANVEKNFADPPITYWPRPLWFWNDTEVNVNVLENQMEKSKTLNKYGGFGILPFGKSFRPEYLSQEYFAVYRAVLDKARVLGMTMSLYDEYGFPSGPAGAPNSSDISLFEQRFPDMTIKRLDKHEETVTGPAKYTREVPAGRIMSIVAMNIASKKRFELTKRISENWFEWDVPVGTWKIMTFACIKDGYPACDYLDPSAVEKFVEITHQAYYDRFKEHFGTTIDSTFHDEPTLYRAEGRTWTDTFNEKFEARHGFDPKPYYPALWYDIGPETQAARNYLFGFRAELYTLGFPKVIQEWCDKHSIEATGHQDQEEVINPVSVSGDLMKCFKHQDIPGVDKIGGNRPAERIYKIISSSAYNWDKALVMSETYGAMGNLGWQDMYAVAMEQYTKGINMLIPHAVWYDDRHVTFKPELSYRSPIYGEGLVEFNTFVARMNVLLQNDGRHVSDIAVLYPIATLQGSHHLDGPLGFYKGGVGVPEADYMDVGEVLIAEVGRDYTFIHPEVLDQKCTVDGNELVLENRIHPGRFKILILPGHETIRWTNLAEIREFYEAGGKVIATGILPSKSAEFGHDADVAQTVKAMFGAIGSGSTTGYGLVENARGGMAIHLNSLRGETLGKALDVALDVYDVEFESNRSLRYIHKIKDGRHIYMFANIGQEPINTSARLRGVVESDFWNPHTGEISGADYAREVESGLDVTVVKLRLAPFRSVFVVGTRP